MKSLSAFLPIATVMLAAAAQGTLVITEAGISVSAVLGDFVGSGTDRGEISLPVSSTSGHGFYTYTPGTGMALTASGSGTPSFSMTFQNDSGTTLTGFTLTGTVYQFKDNSSNITETLTASVSGAVSFSPTSLSFTNVLNDGDTSSSANNPPLTKAFLAEISGITWNPGESFTITWSDANDGGTDAMFGLGDVSVIAAVPEPASALLGAVGLLGILRRRR